MLITIDERARVETLSSYHILDTPPEESFDRITRLAATILQTPIAMISMVDRHRLWLKSALGVSVREIPRDMSFCTHAIQGDDAFVVPDTLEDPRFSSNPLVVGNPNIRFYIGMPLRMQNGQTLGALCTLDMAPHHPTVAQIAMLADLARMVVDEIELRQLAMTDSLTGALTRRGLETRLQSELDRSQRYGRAMSILAIDIDHFKKVNDAFGHAAGDEVLQAVVATCQARLRTTDVIGRSGGEEFIVILPETEADEALHVAEQLRSAIGSLAVPQGPQTLSITASFGVTSALPADRLASHMMRRADRALYIAKARGRNQVVPADITG